MTGVSMDGWIWIWMIAAAVILGRHWRTGVGSGLVFAYVLSFGAMHALAPAMYLLPWYDSDRAFLTGLGLRESALAMVAFAVGTELARLVVRRQLELRPELREATPTVDNRIVNLYLIGGLAAYALTPVLSRLPSGSAIVAAGSTLGVVAIGLKCWNAWADKRWTTLWLWLAGTMTMPLITVVGQGFLGYGFAAMLSVMAFVASFYRPRWQVVAAGSLLLYLGLSVYVTYMRDRDDIRDIVWAGASVEDRFGQLQYTASTAEWFDPENEAHLRRVDNRLNQDFLIGAAVVYLENGMVRYAGGATILAAAVAVVPRALWPDKPTVAGSGSLVADYTGITFAEGTSVGIGQVLETYVNFGRGGIIIGFFLIGGLLSFVDRRAQMRLRAGEAARFLRWYLPGLALLQVGGSFAEISTTAGAAWLVAVGLNRISNRLYPDRRSAARRLEDAGTLDSPEVLR
jgi:hypothetical protein